MPTGHPLPAGDTGKQAKLVMIVDDDASVLGALERLLSFWGYRTLPIGSFEDARHALSQYLPDALVTDVRLGDYNGLQLVHLMKQRNPGAVVIAISGIDDPVLRTEAANVGAAYLMKPTELPQLREHLARCVPNPLL